MNAQQQQQQQLQAITQGQHDAHERIRLIGIGRCMALFIFLGFSFLIMGTIMTATSNNMDTFEKYMHTNPLRTAGIALLSIGGTLFLVSLLVAIRTYSRLKNINQGHQLTFRGPYPSPSLVAGGTPAQAMYNPSQQSYGGIAQNQGSPYYVNPSAPVLAGASSTPALYNAAPENHAHISQNKPDVLFPAQADSGATYAEVAKFPEPPPPYS